MIDLPHLEKKKKSNLIIVIPSMFVMFQFKNDFYSYV